VLCGRLRLKCDGTRAWKPDAVFVAKLTSSFKSAGERQFSQILAADVCASVVVIRDTACSKAVWMVLATHWIRQFSPSLSLPCVTVCHHISTANYSRQLTLPLPSPHNTYPTLKHSQIILPSTYWLYLNIHKFCAALKLSIRPVPSILHMLTWPKFYTIYWGYFNQSQWRAQKYLGGSLFNKFFGVGSMN
jgi:hypothetical protein